MFAGVRQAITDNIDVTVKYRFFNVPDLKYVAQTGTTGATARDVDTRFRSHSLLGGITFNFGGEPEPAPTPPPPPPVAGPSLLRRRRRRLRRRRLRLASAVRIVVFFDWDKDEITPQAAAILDNAAAAYRRPAARLRSCSPVTPTVRVRPSTMSACPSVAPRNVRAYLAGRGIPDGVITQEAFGESRPLVETADGVREPQNRRVEITYGPGSGW